MPTDSAGSGHTGLSDGVASATRGKEKGRRGQTCILMPPDPRKRSDVAPCGGTRPGATAHGAVLHLACGRLTAVSVFAMTRPSHARRRTAAEVAFGDVHVVEVPVELHMRRADLAADSYWLGAAVETMPLVVDADVHRLEDQHHVVPLSDRSGAF